MPEPSPDILVPEHPLELSRMLADASRRRERLVPVGLGTRRLRGASGQPRGLSLSALPVECEIDADERVLTASSQLALADLMPRLAKHGLFLPPLLAPAEYAATGTLGGLYADPRESPLTPRLGRVRDHVLGIEAVRGDGTAFKAGGRVVKNVTGYDLTRFLCGARGRHAVITRVHWRLDRAPETLQVARVLADDLASAWRALLPLRALPVEPLCIALRPPGELWLVECGPRAVVAAHLERALAVLDAAATTPTAPAPEDWPGLVGTPPSRCDALLLRIQAPFSRWGELLEGPLAVADAHPIEWQGIFPAAHFGLAWLPDDEHARARLAALDAQLQQHGGRALPERLPAQGDVDWESAWPATAPPFAHTLFASWDPAGVLE